MYQEVGAALLKGVNRHQTKLPSLFIWKKSRDFNAFYCDMLRLEGSDGRVWIGPGIVITEGMVNMLRPNELRFILGHELGHMIGYVQLH